MKIPKSIQIGPLTINVVYVDNLIAERDCWGEFSDKEQEIRIQSGLSVERTRETFFHEMTEAINSMYNMQLKHDHIQIFGLSLAQALGLDSFNNKLTTGENHV